jgi:hypothetical protein
MNACCLLTGISVDFNFVDDDAMGELAFCIATSCFLTDSRCALSAGLVFRAINQK